MNRLILGPARLAGRWCERLALPTVTIKIGSKFRYKHHKNTYKYTALVLDYQNIWAEFEWFLRKLTPRIKVRPLSPYRLTWAEITEETLIKSEDQRSIDI